MGGSVLVVDDDRSLGEAIAKGLSKRGFRIVSKASAEEALAALALEHFDAVVTDLRLRGTSGTELCCKALETWPDLPVIIMTAFGSMEAAIDAIRCGAYDFITKPFDLEVLVFALERAIQHSRLQEEVKRLRGVAATQLALGDIVGESPVMQKVLAVLERVAESDASVLITGETGTGKEAVARALHQSSRRSSGPFVAISCAAVPATLLESELFGHAKGAFTDARFEHVGLFVQAHGGTLFLDEIGDMPLNLQPKLLRALQERSVRPIGGSKEVSFDVRVIAATNADLEGAVDDGTFRSDLYFRLNVIHLDLPPLRARGDDISLLAQRFLEQATTRAKKPVLGISRAAARQLLTYPWPGNVRELQNCIERAVALTEHERLLPEDLPEKISAFTPAPLVLASSDPAEFVPMHEVERRYIEQVLQAVSGNKSRAARLLGFDRGTLSRKLAAFESDPLEQVKSSEASSAPALSSKRRTRSRKP